LDLQYADNGVGDLPGMGGEFNKGIFKIPFIRNVGLTAPYMHDGRFETLEEVIEHYSTGIKAHPNLSDQLPVGGFNYTQDEKDALMAFLDSMTDNEFTKEPRYADPFK